MLSQSKKAINDLPLFSPSATFHHYHSPSKVHSSSLPPTSPFRKTLSTSTVPDLMILNTQNTTEAGPSEKNTERLMILTNREASPDPVVSAMTDARRLAEELRADTSRLQDIHLQMRRHALLMGLLQSAMTASRSRDRISCTSISQPEQILQLDTFAREAHLLPTVAIYKPDPDRGSLGCLICLEDFTNNLPIFVLACHEYHNFHVACFLNWARRQFSCPVCFSSFEPDI